ncbi:M81 family metallopeptidase [Labrenzia sp. DG1229]|uniref:M81 family metallopeptidase n=1 Tax=Labrenzia sp. DG1229 TaxID=681847 RepID=UPI00048D1220|nr:M81 family metallopeptidase [Labrenzia sp. DG1229]
MKIAVGGIHTECSTYSPLHQEVEDFDVVRGTELLEQTGLGKERFPDTTFCPLFHARSIPGGPVSTGCYLTFKSGFLAELQASLPVDGVLLIMHGAMHVPDIDDPEGDWISAVRDVVGPEVPIAVSYDLHGNVTQKIIDQIDIFCAYRTAPHIDVRETHLRAADNLVDQLAGGPRRSVVWAAVPVLLPGERTSTEDEPVKSIYRELPHYDRQQGIADANLMIGYVWADTGRATAAAVVTGTEPDRAAFVAREIAARYWAARNDLDFGVPTMPLPDCLDDAEHVETFPFILADSGDNPTGGGVGDRTDILKAWLDRGMTGAVFAGIADPGATEKAWEAFEGDVLSLDIGGSFGSDCPRLTISAVVGKKAGTKTGRNREVLIHVSENSVILTERRRPFHNIVDFRRFGIDPTLTRYLIVKSGYLSPELAPLANPARMALTDGAVNQDIPALKNENRTNPTYPFRTNFDWHPKSLFSKRLIVK